MKNTWSLYTTGVGMTAEVRERVDQPVDIVAIGSKAAAFFKRLKVNLVATITHLGEIRTFEAFVGALRQVCETLAIGRRSMPRSSSSRLISSDLPNR